MEKLVIDNTNDDFVIIELPDGFSVPFVLVRKNFLHAGVLHKMIEDGYITRHMNIKSYGLLNIKLKLIETSRITCDNRIRSCGVLYSKQNFVQKMFKIKKIPISDTVEFKHKYYIGGKCLGDNFIEVDFSYI